MIRILSVVGVTAILAFYLFFAGSVSKKPDARDLKAIATLNADSVCEKTSSFETQLRCIRFIQRSIQIRIPDMRCADSGRQIEPLDFIEDGHGCCHDRARFMEKALEKYGFRTRYLSLHDASHHGFLAYFVPKVASHAAIDVWTQRGWLGVDSNEPFILLGSDGRAFSFRDLVRSRRESLDAAIEPRAFYQGPLLITYGLYSRHGWAHGINLPAPEMNYADFFRYQILGSDK